MEIYKVWTTQDIENIPTDTPVHLEIYLRNAVIPLQHINANCAVRAEGCKFPNLTLVKGNLSIDARAAKFPVLKTVEGDCDIHCLGIELPCLQCVKGVLSIEANVELPSLLKVGNCIKNKINRNHPQLTRSNEIKLSQVTQPKKRLWEVYTEEDVAQLPLYGKFSLIIRGNNLTFPHTEFKGAVLVKGKNIAFPHLQTINKITVGKVADNIPENQILLPQLRTITANCVIREGVFVAPQLECIKNKLIIEGNGSGEFPLLKTVGIFYFSSKKRVYFPSLYKIYGNFSCPKITPLTFFSIPNVLDEQQQKADFFSDINHLPNIPSISDSGFPALEFINGIFTLTATTTILPRLRQIGKLRIGIDKDIAPYLPSIESIHYALYQEPIKHIGANVEQLFFPVTNNLVVSTHYFYINAHWAFPYNFWRADRHSLNILVSLLKMRHFSFQNFVMDEFEREWIIHNDLINKVLQSIERKWTRVPRYSLQDIFMLYDSGLKHFCFTYIGVAQMMAEFKAKCIISNGINLRYFRYDALGDKIQFMKHNIYEIYEADLSELYEAYSSAIYSLKHWNDFKDKRYAVKCTCTYNNYEQWFWVEEQYKNDPLEAIASTFTLRENVIPFIKCIKRKGNALICEMNEEVMPSGYIRPLTKEEYFGLLEVEA